MFTVLKNKSDAPPPALDADWDAAPWSDAQEAVLLHFRPEGSSHRPEVRVRLLHDEQAIHVRFRVLDRYVRCVCTTPQGSVCQDSCVEWFVQPRPDRGYLNFEINCGGTVHSSYIEDPVRRPDGFTRWRFISAEDLQALTIRHTLPTRVEPERTEPVIWEVGLTVPRTVLEHYVGPLGPLTGQTWRCNFYKCGDQTSHKHWVSWQPVGELNFHRPQDFGPLAFG